jgi:hypothetical protein
MLVFGKVHIYGKPKKDLESHVDVRIYSRVLSNNCSIYHNWAVGLTEICDSRRHTGPYRTRKHEFGMVDR